MRYIPNPGICLWGGGESMKRDNVLSFPVLFARLPSVLLIAATIMFSCFALAPVFAAMSNQAPVAPSDPTGEPNIPAKGPDVPLPPVIVSNPYAPPKRSAKLPLTRASDMRFAIVRSATSTCEPSCSEWITAYGTIKPDTPSKLRKGLQKLGKRRLPIVIDSNGGAVLAAMEMIEAFDAAFERIERPDKILQLCLIRPCGG